MSININDLESTETNQTILDDLDVSRNDIYVNDVINIPLIKGEKGDTGDTGPANKLTIGTVERGDTASATITGESPNQVLNLVLPKGDTGEAGTNGTNGQNGQDGANGQDGSNGSTFTPSVSAEGIISFTNDGGLENPIPVNIKGPAGQNGANGQNGTNGQGVPTGGTTGQILIKTSNTDYDTQWKSLPSKTHSVITTNSKINQNTNYEILEYTLGNNSLSIFFEGEKLIKDINYIEVDTTHIQFKDWDVPTGSNLEIIVKGGI